MSEAVVMTRKNDARMTVVAEEPQDWLDSAEGQKYLRKLFKESWQEYLKNPEDEHPLSDGHKLLEQHLKEKDAAEKALVARKPKKAYA